jgi:hypothetical protein
MDMKNYDECLYQYLQILGDLRAEGIESDEFNEY